MKPVKAHANQTPLSGSARVIQNLPKLLLWLLFTGLLLQTPITSRWLDFPVYWEAGNKALNGFTVYDVVGHFQYKYSPFIALLFGKAFQWMSFETASWAFQKSMLILWLFLFVKLARKNIRTVMIALLFFGSAIRLDLQLGQINALVFYLLMLQFASLERESSWKEDLAFGFIFSISIQLKLFCLILLPLLLLQKEWRKLFLGALFLPLISIGGVAITHGWSFALQENQAWFQTLTQSTDELVLSPQNVALLGSATKLTGLLIGKTIWALCGAGFLFYVLKNRGRPIEWFRNRLLYAISIFNPLVWSYWVVFAFPLYLERIEKLEVPSKTSKRLVLGLAFVFIAIAFNGQHATWAWQGGILLGLLVLGPGLAWIDSLD